MGIASQLRFKGAYYVLNAHISGYTVAVCTVHEHENNFEILLLRGPVNFSFQMFSLKVTG